MIDTRYQRNKIIRRLFQVAAIAIILLHLLDGLPRAGGSGAGWPWYAETLVLLLVSISAIIWSQRVAVALDQEHAEAVQNANESRLSADDLKLYLRALEGVSSVIVILEKTGDQPFDWNFSYANPSLEQVTGYALAELMDPAVAWELASVVEFSVLEEIRLAMTESRPCAVRLALLHKTGREIRMEVRLSPVRDEDGRVQHFIAIADDITASLQQEFELRRQRLYTETLVENAQSAIFMKDRDGRYILANQALERMFGIPKATYMGRLDQDIFTPELAAYFRQSDLDVLRTGEPVTVEDIEDGLYSLTTKFPIKDARGEVIAVAGIRTDVTELKRIQRELEEKQRFIERVTEVLPSSLYINDLIERKIVFQNRGVADLMGVTADELLAGGFGLLEAHIHPDDRPLIEQRYQQMADLPDGQIIELEFRLRHVKGRWLWTNSREIVFRRTPDGRIQQILGVASDVTARREAEEALKRSQRFIARVAEAVPDVIYINDLFQMTNEYRNRSPLTMLALPEDEPSDSLWEAMSALVHPDDEATLLEQLPRLGAMPDGEVLERTVRMKRGDGSYAWINMREVIFERDMTGLPQRVLGVLRDVTASKEANEALRRSERFNQRLAAVIPDVVTVINVQTFQVEFSNRSLLQVLGYERPTWHRSLVEMLPDVVHPEDVALLAASAAAWGALPDGGVHEKVIRLRRADNSWAWVNIRESVFDRDAQDFPLRICGIIQDISARKKAADDLAWREVQYRDLYLASQQQARALRESEDRFRRLWASSQRQAQELKLLEQARAALANVLDVQHLIPKLVHQVSEIFGYALVSLYLIEDKELVLQYQLGYPPEQAIARIPLHQGVIGRAARAGEVIRVVDTAVDLDFLMVVDGVTSEIAVPLKIGGEVIGVFNVESADMLLTEDDLRVLTSLSYSMSMAVNRAQLYTSLSESEGRLRQIAENSDQVFWIHDLVLDKLIYVSPAYGRVWRQPFDSFEDVQRTFLQAVHPDDRERVARMSRQAPVSIDFRILWPDGEERWVQASTFPVHNEQGEVYRIVGISYDITERVRIEQAERDQRTIAEAFRDVAETLSQSLNFEEVLDQVLDSMRKVVDFSSAYIMLVEGDSCRFVRFSDNASREFTNEAQMKNYHLDELYGVREILRTRRPVINNDVHHTPGWASIEGLRADEPSYLGVPITLDEEIIGIIHLNGPIGTFFTAEDAERLATFAKQAAVALQNARLYQQAQALATLEERQRLARELHDAVSQTLFSASVVAETLVRIYEQKSPEEIKHTLDQLKLLNRGALAEMRTLLAELRPSAIVDTEFPQLLKHLTDAAAGHLQVPVRNQMISAAMLPPDVQVVFYRIAQEALSNIVKHARPRNIQVQYDYDGLTAHLVIEDDGRGFDPSKPMPGHFGLSIMRERAESIGAELTIESTPGQGSRLELGWDAASIEHSQVAMP